MNATERAQLRMHVTQAARWLEELQSEARSDHPILSDIVECMDEVEVRLGCIRRLVPEHLRVRSRRSVTPSVLRSASMPRGG
jgi:hypothetical protein